jgi:hypothetical protein
VHTFIALPIAHIQVEIRRLHMNRKPHPHGMIHSAARPGSQ